VATEPEASQSPPSARELISGLKSELDHYSKLVDLEASGTRLRQEIEDRNDQLSRIIDDIKDKESSLRQMDTSVRLEIKRQHDQLSAKLSKERDRAESPARVVEA